MVNKDDEMYIYTVIAKNLKKYRKQAKLSQLQLSMKSTYSKSFLSNLESIKTHQTVSIGTLQTLAKVLNIPTYYLLMEDEEE